MRPILQIGLLLIVLSSLAASGSCDQAAYNQCLAENCDDLGARAQICGYDCRTACDKKANPASEDPDVLECIDDVYFPEMMSCVDKCRTGSSDGCASSAYDEYCECVKFKKTGDGVCDNSHTTTREPGGSKYTGGCVDENCENAPEDCPCRFNERCNLLWSKEPWGTANSVNWDPWGCVHDVLGPCGDSECEFEYGGESCATCPQDCQCLSGITVCNPGSPDADTYGCAYSSAGGSIQTTPGLLVGITTDKESYLIGETVYGTITVKDAAASPVPSADLRVVATRMVSGESKEMTGSTNAMGETSLNFVWGKDDAGKTIKEGKLRLDVTASKTGHSPGTASKTISGCGDLECSAEEDCVDCGEDCNCSVSGGICDPSNEYKDPKTFCAPKTAYVFVSEGLSSYHEWWTSDDQELIRKRYASLGYTVAPTMAAGHINDIGPYLSRPSMKAMAYFGHGEDPDPGVTAIPSIEAAEANAAGYSIKSAVAAGTDAPKGYRYACQFVTHSSKFVGATKDKINSIVDGRTNSPNLDYAFIFACYSLEDTSIRDYLMRSGGTYWGYKGKLPGNADLTPSVKP